MLIMPHLDDLETDLTAEISIKYDILLAIISSLVAQRNAVIISSQRALGYNTNARSS